MTAAFEGHGFTLIQGNWDGAWLTWGIIGFTLLHGELRSIVLEVFARDPDVVRGAFGDQTDELIQILNASRAEQQQWADRISVGPKKFAVAEPWRSSFAHFGQREIVQAVQLRHALDDYFTPAVQAARRYGLKTERGIALCFDIHLQNGGIKPEAQAAIAAALDAGPPPDEQSLRILITNAVADIGGSVGGATSL